jgi:hypothetical protein
MSDRDAIIREIAKKRVVHRLPGMDTLPVRPDLTYRSTGGSPLPLDIYYPSATTRPAPVVLAPLGYPDPQGGVRSFGPLISWAQLIAASGMAAVLYANERPDEDAAAALQHLRASADALALDTDRLGLFAFSGNGPVALATMMRDRGVKCAALMCAYTMDLDGSTTVAEMSRQFGFVNACAGKSIDNFPIDVPLLLIRAGRDSAPGLNAALDRVIELGLERNLPLSVVNHATGEHGFELDEDASNSVAIIQQTLDFLRRHIVTATCHVALS